MSRQFSIVTKFVGRNNKILCRNINLWPHDFENIVTWNYIVATIEMSQHFVGPINFKTIA